MSDLIDMDDEEFADAKRRRDACSAVLTGATCGVASNVIGYLMATYVAIENELDRRHDDAVLQDLTDLAREFLAQHRKGVIDVLNNPRGNA